MRNIYVVRADYYSSGLIVPIGITYDDGEMEFIQVISKYEKINKDGKAEMHMFGCTTNKGEVNLVFHNAIWTLL